MEVNASERKRSLEVRDFLIDAVKARRERVAKIPTGIYLAIGNRLADHHRKQTDTLLTWIRRGKGA